MQLQSVRNSNPAVMAVPPIQIPRNDKQFLALLDRVERGDASRDRLRQYDAAFAAYLTPGGLSARALAFYERVTVDLHLAGTHVAVLSAGRAGARLLRTAAWLQSKGEPLAAYLYGRIHTKYTSLKWRLLRLDLPQTHQQLTTAAQRVARGVEQLSLSIPRDRGNALTVGLSGSLWEQPELLTLAREDLEGPALQSEHAIFRRAAQRRAYHDLSPNRLFHFFVFSATHEQYGRDMALVFTALRAMANEGHLDEVRARWLLKLALAMPELKARLGEDEDRIVLNLRSDDASRPSRFPTSRLLLRLQTDYFAAGLANGWLHFEGRHGVDVTRELTMDGMRLLEHWLMTGRLCTETLKGLTAEQLIQISENMALYFGVRGFEQDLELELCRRLSRETIVASLGFAQAKGQPKLLSACLNHINQQKGVQVQRRPDGKLTLNIQGSVPEPYGRAIALLQDKVVDAKISQIIDPSRLGVVAQGSEYLNRFLRVVGLTYAASMAVLWVNNAAALQVDGITHTAWPAVVVGLYSVATALAVTFVSRFARGFFRTVLQGSWRSRRSLALIGLTAIMVTQPSAISRLWAALVGGGSFWVGTINDIGDSIMSYWKWIPSASSYFWRPTTAAFLERHCARILVAAPACRLARSLGGAVWRTLRISAPDLQGAFDNDQELFGCRRVATPPRQALHPVVASLPRDLRTCDLTGCCDELSDHDLAWLVDHCPHLAELTLAPSARVTEAGWRHIVRLDGLKILRVRVDSHSKHIAALNRIRLDKMGLPRLPKIEVEMHVRDYHWPSLWAFLKSCPAHTQLKVKISPLRSSDYLNYLGGRLPYMALVSAILPWGDALAQGSFYYPCNFIYAAAILSGKVRGIFVGEDDVRPHGWNSMIASKLTELEVEGLPAYTLAADNGGFLGPASRRVRSVRWSSEDEAILRRNVTAIAERCPNLQELRLHNSAIRAIFDNGVNDLMNTTSVEHLVQHCPALRNVSLVNQWRLGNGSLQALARLQDIRSVIVTECELVSDVGVDLLLNKPSLQLLHLQGTPNVSPERLERAVRLSSRTLRPLMDRVGGCVERSFSEMRDMMDPTSRAGQLLPLMIHVLAENQLFLGDQLFQESDLLELPADVADYRNRLFDALQLQRSDSITIDLSVLRAIAHVWPATSDDQEKNIEIGRSHLSDERFNAGTAILSEAPDSLVSQDPFFSYIPLFWRKMLLSPNVGQAGEQLRSAYRRYLESGQCPKLTMKDIEWTVDHYQALIKERVNSHHGDLRLFLNTALVRSGEDMTGALQGLRETIDVEQIILGAAREIGAAATTYGWSDKEKVVAFMGIFLASDWSWIVPHLADEPVVAAAAAPARKEPLEVKEQKDRNL